MINLAVARWQTDRSEVDGRRGTGCARRLHNARGARAAESGAGSGAIDARPGGVNGSRAASERHGGAPTPRGGPAARAARVGRHARCGMRQRRARRAGPR
ncbi:unnamed protein product [Leptosia nina]|uniref:Uncharacterized protein n=1 Tax=Leptosia nina TaxID=320188 RepID=A0AAV1JFI0_9NEOP